MAVSVKNKEKVDKKEENDKKSGNDVTIEIIAALTLLSVTLVSSGSKTLGLRKVCDASVNWRYCDDLLYQGPLNSFHNTVYHQEYAWNMIWWTAVQILTSGLVLTFLGGWSDKTGRRKVILTLPVIGVGLQVINNMIHTIFFYTLPLELFLFFDAFFGGIVSGSIIFLGFFTYIFEVTTPDNRLYKFSAVLLCALAGLALGSILYRLLFYYFNYYGLYCFVIITNLINSWCIKKKINEPFRTSEQIMYDNQNSKEFYRTFFDFSTIKETIKVVRQNEPNKRNYYMYTYLATIFILFISVFGERSVFDLIARFDYRWDQNTINVFNLYNIFTTILGIWISTAVISKKFNNHDAVIGIASTVSKIVSSFIFAFSLPENIFYLGPAVDALNGASLVAIVSMYSKLLERNEIGKITALVCIIEGLARLVYVTVYYFMYTGTHSQASVYLVGAFVFTLPALLVFIWILVKEKKEEANQNAINTSTLTI